MLLVLLFWWNPSMYCRLYHLVVWVFNKTLQPQRNTFYHEGNPSTMKGIQYTIVALYIYYPIYPRNCGWEWGVAHELPVVRYSLPPSIPPSLPPFLPPSLSPLFPCPPPSPPLRSSLPLSAFFDNYPVNVSQRRKTQTLCTRTLLSQKNGDAPNENAVFTKIHKSSERKGQTQENMQTLRTKTLWTLMCKSPGIKRKVWPEMS